MILYDPRSIEHGLLLAGVWGHLLANGELKQTVAENARSLPGFFRMLEPPTVALFVTDEQGAWVLAWCEPCFNGAFFSLWVRPDKRSKDALPTVYELYEMALGRWPVLMGVTKQARLLSSHEKMGYKLLGQIPGLFDGEDAFLLVLTKEDFDGRRRREGREQSNVGQP